jgi:hypothetical protein
VEGSEAQASVGAARKAVESQEYQRLKPNSLGLLGVVFMVVATAAPIAAMTANVPIGVGFGSGIGTPATYLLVTIMLTIFAVGYVTMARYITATGAFYAYISHGLGTVVGMASGLLAVMAYIVFEAAVAGLFASFAQTTISDQLGFNVPWPVLAGLLLALNAFFGYRAINLTAKVLGFFWLRRSRSLPLWPAPSSWPVAGRTGSLCPPLTRRTPSWAWHRSSGSFSPSGPGWASSPRRYTARSRGTRRG